MHSTSWTLVKLILWIEKSLNKKNISGNNKLNSEILASHIVKINRRALYFHSDKIVSEQEINDAAKLLLRMYDFEPIEYIVGETEFLDLKIKIKSQSLIPRIDTETLALLAFDYWQRYFQHEKTTLFDFCCGSGVLGLYLANHCHNAHIVLSEYSCDALDLTKLNFLNYNEQIEKQHNSYQIIHSDKFEKLDKKLRYDLIITNPPYIKTNQIDELDSSVKDYEPLLALDGGADGLDFYRYIARQSQAYLKDNGFILLEHGIDQEDEIIALFLDNHYKLKEQAKDMQGISRCLVFEKESS